MENAQYNVAINILIMENICLFIKILILRLHHWYRLPKENTLSYINIVLCVHAKLLQLCLTLRDTMNYSLPGSSVHGISQARILEWVVISFSRGSSQPRDRTSASCSSCIAGRFFTTEPPGKLLSLY